MKKVLALLSLFVSLSVMGATYYVAPNGSDGNNGSISQPYATLNKAWTVVSAGDIIYMRGGTYYFSSQQMLRGKNGSAGNHIKVWAYPGETPVLSRGSSYDYEYSCGIYFVGNYVHFKGLEITGYRQLNQNVWSGLWVQNSDHNIFEALNIHHNGHGLFIREDSDDNLVLNSDFHHNSDPETSPAYENADGLQIAYIPSGRSNRVEGCRMWSNSDDGLDLWRNEGYVSIKNSWAWSNGYIPGTGTAAGNGNAFKLGQQNIDHGSQVLRSIKNCVTYNNRQRGFDQNGARCQVELFNNISYRNVRNGFLFTTRCVAKNNIAHRDDIDPVFTSSSDLSHNTFNTDGNRNSNYNLSDEDFVSLDASQLSRSRNADGSLPSIEFLHLRESSDLVDGGTSVGIAYNGSAPDLGAFEYGDYIPPTPDIPVNTGMSFDAASPTIIELSFNEAINSQEVPPVNNFNVQLNGNTNFDVESINISEFIVELTLEDPVNASGTLSVGYTKTGSSVLQNWHGGEVESFTTQTSVTIDNQSEPVNTGMGFDEASPTIIELYFSEAINSQEVPPSSNFSVQLNGNTTFNVASISISEFVVRLTLANPVNASGTLSVAYTKTGSMILQNWHGGEVPSFTTQRSVSIDTPPQENFLARIFPSPAGEYISIHILGAPITSPHFIRFYDASGEMVYEDNLKTNASSIPVSFLPGVYLVDIGLGSKVLFSQRIVLN